MQAEIKTVVLVTAVSQFNVLAAGSTSGTARKANPANAGESDALIGIAIEAGSIGDTIHYQTAGWMLMPAADFDDGTPVYVAADGTLSKTPAAVPIQVGTGAGETTVVIDTQMEDERADSSFAEMLVLGNDADGNPIVGLRSLVADTKTGILAITAPNGFTANGIAIANVNDVASATTLLTAHVAKNVVFAGPGSGADAAPAFRPLVADDLPGQVVEAGTADNDVALWDNTAKEWKKATKLAAITALLPDQTSNSGKFLTTNGSGTLSWDTPA